MLVKKTIRKEQSKLDNRLRMNIALFYAGVLILFGLIIDTPSEIIIGFREIITTKDILITDYIMVGGIGASFINAGLLMLLFILILRYYKINFNGITYAALFLVAGFSLFGKNIFNVWPIIIGVYLYSLVQGEKFSKYIYIAMFGTAISPIFTAIIYNDAFPLHIRVPLGIVVAVFIGFILPPLSIHFLKVHEGYNLYNVGFTAGIIGMIAISILKSHNMEIESHHYWSTGNNQLFSIFLFSLFLSMIVIGVTINHRDIIKRLKATFSYPGRLVTDLFILEGTSTSFINMGLLGCVATAYILLIGGDLNGPTIGGILTVSGFAGFGKNIKNTIPIFIGVYLGSLTGAYEIDQPALQLAALFATSLAPIAGEYGVIFGILAGFVHSSVVLAVGTLHGGVNLYNNGFAAGFVAAVFVPILEVFRKDETD